MSQQLFDRSETQIIGTPLSRLLRRLAYGLGIDSDRYIALHSNYSKRENRDPGLIVSHRNNVRKAILRDKPTFNMFYFFISEILRLDIMSMSITVRSRITGLQYTVSSNDVPAMEPGMLQPDPTPAPPSP